MLKNFVILPGSQVPDFPPFQGSMCVTDGTCARPEGFDFERDGDLIVDLKKMGVLEDGQPVFYLPSGDTPQQVLYNDCGRITGIRLVSMQMGGVIAPPKTKVPYTDMLYTAAVEQCESENYLRLVWYPPDDVDADPLEITAFLVLSQPHRDKREIEDNLVAHLVGRWQMIRQIHEIMDGKEWDSDTAQAIGQVLTDFGFVIRDPNDMEDDS